MGIKTSEILNFWDFWPFGTFFQLSASKWKGTLGKQPTLSNQPKNAKWAQKCLISGQKIASVSLQEPQPDSLEKSKYFIFALFDILGLDLQLPNVFQKVDILAKNGQNGVKNGTHF